VNTEDSTAFPAVPDSFQRLWTPHRMAYIQGESKPRTEHPHECPFCLAPEHTDEEGLIVYRGSSCYVVLNLFPYNPGHLLICPYRHVADLTDLTDAERYESADLVANSMKVLRQVKQPAGFNLGMNQGSAAGAGVAGHAHQHVVPRWSGDSNFLPIIAQTKALPELLAQTRDELAENWINDGAGK